MMALDSIGLRPLTIEAHMNFRLALPATVIAFTVFLESCGTPPQLSETEGTATSASQATQASAQPSVQGAATEAHPATTAAGTPAATPSAAPSATESPENAPQDPEQQEAEQTASSDNAPVPHQDAAGRKPMPAQPSTSDGSAEEVAKPNAGWGRSLVGSCRLYFADDSARCREIYGNSQARLIEIFIKHCQAEGNDYEGEWTEQACPAVLAEKDRVGGCLSEDPDYSTIAYSYVDPNDALAKGLVPLVRTQCRGTFIPER